MQGFILTAITAAVKCKLVLDFVVNFDSHWSAKHKQVMVHARRVFEGQILSKVSLIAITAAEKCTIILDLKF